MKKNLLVLFGMLFAVSAWATDSVKIVVGYGPGNINNVIRMFAADAENHSDLKFRVENKPGANGVIAVKEYLKETPALTSALGASAGQLVFEALANPENNFLKDLKVIGPVIASPLAMAVNTDSNIKSFADLFDRSQPRRRINIATGGESHQMLVNLIAKHSHHDIQGVRFKGGADGFTALRGGHVDAMIDAYGWFTQHVPSIRILGVAQQQNLKHAPSMHRQLPDATLVNWFAIVINRQVRDTRALESALNNGFIKNNRIQQWEDQGYNIDLNPNGDYMDRVAIPTYNKWRGLLGK